jgi:CheY-like chemotaxis protein
VALTHTAHSSVSAPGQNRPLLTGKTVLIADDSATTLDVMSARCERLGLHVETSTDGLRTLLKVSKIKPDLLILDLGLPDVDGFKVVERLTDPKFPPLPVIVLTARSDHDSIQRCEALGVFYIRKGVDCWDELEATIFRMFLNKDEANVPAPAQSVASKIPRILLVDDNPVVLKSLVSSLQKYDVEIIQASSGMQGFWLTLRSQPDLIVTDYNMDQGSGHYLLSRIKSNPSVQHIPVIVFTGETLPQRELYPIDRDLRGRGQAAAFITKAHDTPALIEQIKRHVSLRGKV